MARRPHLAGTAYTTSGARLEPDGRPNRAKWSCRNAQLCGRTDAAWPLVSRWRCGPYRSSDRREGAELCRLRCACSGKSLHKVLSIRQQSRFRDVFSNVFATGLESAAVLLVDDVHAAPFPRRESLRSAAATRRTRLRYEFPGGLAKSGGKLCWLADRRIK